MKQYQRIVLAASMEQLFEEARLITEKRSNLPKAMRDFIMQRFQFHVSKGHYKVEA